MPTPYVKKFQAFLINIEEVQKEEHLRENMDMSGYEELKGLKELRTDQEKRDLEALREKQRLADTSYQYERIGYMNRQPRVDLSKYNYNYE